jgi:hypothetical protein
LLIKFVLFSNILAHLLHHSWFVSCHVFLFPWPFPLLVLDLLSPDLSLPLTFPLVCPFPWFALCHCLLSSCVMYIVLFRSLSYFAYLSPVLRCSRFRLHRFSLFVLANLVINVLTHNQVIYLKPEFVKFLIQGHGVSIMAEWVGAMGVLAYDDGWCAGGWSLPSACDNIIQ